MPGGVSGEDIEIVRCYCGLVVYKEDGKLPVDSAVAR